MQFDVLKNVLCRFFLTICRTYRVDSWLKCVAHVIVSYIVVASVLMSGVVDKYES